MVAEIAAVTRQQSKSVEKVTHAVEGMNGTTQETAVNAEKAAAAVEELTGQLIEMKNMVNTFNLESNQCGGKRNAS